MTHEYKKAFRVIEDLLTLDGKFNFHYTTFRNWCEDQDSVDSTIGRFCSDHNLTLACGATKGVVICDEWSFVVKIPFLVHREMDYDSSDSYYDNEESVVHYDKCPQKHKSRYTNYVALEYYNYRQLVKRGLGDMAAWIIPIGRFDGVAIYAQQYVECDECKTTDSISDCEYQQWASNGYEVPDNLYSYKSVTVRNHPYYNYIFRPTECLHDGDVTNEYYDFSNLEDRQAFFNSYISGSYDYSTSWEEVSNIFDRDYGCDRLNELNEVIDELDINDIHTANVGFNSEGNVVLTDYSGFMRECSLRRNGYANFHGITHAIRVGA